MTEPQTPAPEPTKRRPWTWQAVVFLVVVFIAVPFGLLAIIWKDRCVTTLSSSVTSPDLAYIVNIFVTDCGPRMKPATEMRLAAAEAPDQGETLLLYQGPPTPLLDWQQGPLLVVTPPQGSLMVKGYREVRGVKIIVNVEKKPAKDDGAKAAGDKAKAPPTP